MVDEGSSGAGQTGQRGMEGGNFNKQQTDNMNTKREAQQPLVNLEEEEERDRHKPKQQPGIS